jgi:transcriptional regulator with XRE-family HTH domain
MKRSTPKNKNLRPMTPRELAASDHIKERLKSLRGKVTQEQVAAEIGVSQGQIWQWANRRLPVPANRAKALAKAIGTSPELVSVEYADVLPTEVREPQPVFGGDPILSDGQRAVLEIFAQLSPEQQATWREVGSALAQQAQTLTEKKGTK